MLYEFNVYTCLRENVGKKAEKGIVRQCSLNNEGLYA